MNQKWERLMELNILVPYMGNLLYNLHEQKGSGDVIYYVENEYKKLSIEQTEIVNSLHNHI
jgi:hypothetical protein